MEEIESNIVRCPDQKVAQEMIERIDQIRKRVRGWWTVFFFYCQGKVFL